MRARGVATTTGLLVALALLAPPSMPRARGDPVVSCAVIDDGRTLRVDLDSSPALTVVVTLSVLGRPGTVIVEHDAAEVAGCRTDVEALRRIAVAGGPGDDGVAISQARVGDPPGDGFPRRVAFAIDLADEVGEDYLDLMLDPARGGRIRIGSSSFVLGSARGSFSDVEYANLYGGAAARNRIDGSAARIAMALFGGGRADVLIGGAGDDTLYGQEGRDHLDGGPGADVLDGGPGRDECVSDPTDAVAC